MKKISKVVLVDNDDIETEDDGQYKAVFVEISDDLSLKIFSYHDCDWNETPLHTELDELIEKGFTLTLEVNS